MVNINGDDVENVNPTQQLGKIRLLGLSNTPQYYASQWKSAITFAFFVCCLSGEGGKYVIKYHNFMNNDYVKSIIWSDSDQPVALLIDVAECCQQVWERQNFVPQSGSQS